MIQPPFTYIRFAKYDDVPTIKQLADAHRRELGFVLLPALNHAAHHDELLIAIRPPNTNIAGFAHFHHRRDSQTTLYHICVHPDYRRLGIGASLILYLRNEAIHHRKTTLLTKCLTELPANAFYLALSFTLSTTEQPQPHGRTLNVWRLEV